MERADCLLEAGEDGLGIDLVEQLAESGDREAMALIAESFLDGPDPELAERARHYAAILAREEPPHDGAPVEVD